MPEVGLATPPHVLIVEDDAPIRRFVRAALEGEGMHVTEADCAQRGLIDAATRRPDLLILDLGLPDRDGVEVIREGPGALNISLISELFPRYRDFIQKSIV